MMSHPRPLVSVVVVSYNRLDLLRQTVTSLLDKVTYPRSSLELILCDDGSPSSIQEQMKALPFDMFLMSAQNRGMAHNTNKGIRAASGQYVLQIQDDWECTGPGDFIDVAIELFNERQDIALIRLWDAFGGPHELCASTNGRTAQIYINQKRWRATAGEYVYSDTPHIKRRALVSTLGLYREGWAMHKVEMDYCRRFESQHEAAAAFIEGYSCFRHTGVAASFNPLAQERRWRSLFKQFPGGCLALQFLHSAKDITMRRLIHNGPWRS